MSARCWAFISVGTNMTVSLQAGDKQEDEGDLVDALWEQHVPWAPNSVAPSEAVRQEAPFAAVGSVPAAFALQAASYPVGPGVEAPVENKVIVSFPRASQERTKELPGTI